MSFEKLGLPELWQTPKLSKCLILNDSGTWGDEATNEDEGYPVLRSTNIQDARLVLEDIAYRIVSQKDAERYLLVNGDILVTKSSGSPQLIGKNAIFVQPDDDRAYLFSNFTQRIRVDQAVLLPDYLYYYLNSSYAQAFLENMHSTTSGLRNLNMNQYAMQPIPLPPLPEQARIVAILRQADELRRLRQQARAKVQQLLDLMFYEMFSRELGKSAGWPETTISQLGTVTYGLTVNRTRREMTPQYAYLRVANVFRWEVDLTDVATIGLAEGNLDRYSLQSGDVLVVEGHANPTELGRAAVWQGELETCLHQNHLLRIRPNPEKATPNYLAGYLNSVTGREHMLRFGKTSSGLNTINSSVLNDLPIPQPPLEVQQAFDRQAAQYRAVLQEIQLSQQKLYELFRGILGQAFSGDLTAEWRQQHQDELESKLPVNGVATHKAPASRDFDLSNNEERAEFDELVRQIMPSVTNQITEALATPITGQIAEGMRMIAVEKLSTIVQPILEDYQAAVNASILRAFQEVDHTVLTTIAENVTSKLISDTSLSTDIKEMVGRLSQLAALSRKITNESHPRYWLLSELSDAQYQTYLACLTHDGHFLAEHLTEQLSLHSHLVSQSLGVLAAVGLIKQVNVPISSGNATIYQPVYRAFVDSDNSQETDWLLFDGDNE